MHLVALAGPPPPPPLPPPFGAKVLLAEELEAAHLVAATGTGQGRHSLLQDVYSTSSGNSHCPPATSPWNNSGTLSFCSLPVLPVGTKVTLLSDLEAGLKGLSVVNGNHGGGLVHAASSSQPLLGSASDCNSLPASSSAAGRPASSSHGDDEVIGGGQQLVSSSGGRPTDLVAYKKLLGLMSHVEPRDFQMTTANNNMSLPVSEPKLLRQLLFTAELLKV